jgi:hypothetical protein
MSDITSVVYHEVDFLLPVHRFNVKFSYVTKEGLPFIREFVLRLLHISALNPLEIATYFGFSKREADEAISDLLDKGDLQFNDEGNVELTSQSKGYFLSLGATPQVSAVKETGATLSFELGAFNCVGKGRTNEKWNHGIKLIIDNEVIANSQRLASENFQRQFYQILENKFISSIRLQDGSDRPRLYTMDSVTKLGQEPLRLTTKFSIDLDGVSIERDDFDSLEDSGRAHELITTSLSESHRASNLTQIAHAMGVLGDNWTRALFNEASIDVSALISDRAVALLEGGDVIPFVGPLYSQNNWELIQGHLNLVLPAIKKRSTEEKLEMVWVAPTDRFWESSHRLPASADGFVSSVRALKCQEMVNSPVMYLPVSGGHDRRTISKWERELGNVLGSTRGLLEGFLDGNVEIILVENSYVVVCYHVYKSESLPVTLPVGFISTNVDIINSVQKVVFEYIKGMASFDNPNDIGSLK